MMMLMDRPVTLSRTSSKVGNSEERADRIIRLVTMAGRQQGLGR